MDIEEARILYRETKAEAVRERNKLEEMRVAFSAQCDKVSSLEATVRRMIDRVAADLLRREGIEP